MIAKGLLDGARRHQSPTARGFRFERLGWYQAHRGSGVRSGIIPIAASQDIAGPMARSVADAAALLTVLAAYDPTTRQPSRSNRKHRWTTHNFSTEMDLKMCASE